jgi:UDP-N-acetylmuramoyl-tripeptide--D-alanyl-D-alanine ligase
MGKHNISNALAAILVAKKAGISPQNIVNGLQNISVTGMRLEKLMSAKGFMIINDAWNASPVSVSAAVETFEELAGFKKKYLVLGDMLELGDKERDYHEQIGELINPLKIDFLYTVGELSRFISSSAKQKFDPDCVKHFDDKDALSSHLAAVLEAGDAVLVKGSRGMEMEDIVNRLLQL